jgi:hypothetical protein
MSSTTANKKRPRTIPPELRQKAEEILDITKTSIPFEQILDRLVQLTKNENLSYQEAFEITTDEVLNSRLPNPSTSSIATRKRKLSSTTNAQPPTPTSSVSFGFPSNPVSPTMTTTLPTPPPSTTIAVEQQLSNLISNDEIPKMIYEMRRFSSMIHPNSVEQEIQQLSSSLNQVIAMRNSAHFSEQMYQMAVLLRGEVAFKSAMFKNNSTQTSVNHKLQMDSMQINNVEAMLENEKKLSAQVAQAVTALQQQPQNITPQVLESMIQQRDTYRNDCLKGLQNITQYLESLIQSTQTRAACLRELANVANSGTQQRLLDTDDQNVLVNFQMMNQVYKNILSKVKRTNDAYEE